MKKWIDERYLKPIFETDSGFSEWFGYYNYDVISRDGKKMLCGRATFDARAITAEDTIDLGWYDIESGQWHFIDNTDSFNWQQGAMLQWLPSDENKVIYNISKDNHFQSVICDIRDGSKRVIDFPTYCVTPDGRYSISLNYERSYWCRAYHYQTIINPEYDVRVAEDDGIFAVDLVSNTVHRIIAIQDVIALDADEDFGSAKHWLEHIMLNSDGTQIAFLHRFMFASGYTTRVCVANIDGSGLQVIPGWRLNDLSHLGWKGNDAFAVYAIKKSQIEAAYAKQISKEEPALLAANGVKKKQKESLKKLLRNIVRSLIPRKLKKMMRRNEKSYQVYTRTNGQYVLTDKYKGELLDIDGHPSFTADGVYMITDSYPDANGHQRLLVFNTKTRKTKQIGGFFAPLSGNPASCDLHPKLSFRGEYLAVDTAYSGKHKMALFALNWDNIKRDLE